MSRLSLPGPTVLIIFRGFFIEIELFLSKSESVVKSINAAQSYSPYQCKSGWRNRLNSAVHTNFET